MRWPRAHPPWAAARFSRVDPDRIARRLPERPQYLEHNPDAASALMLPEAGFLQEVLQNFAMANKRSMVIDGSFSDAKVSLYAALFDDPLRPR